MRRVQSQVGGDEMFGGGMSSGRWVGTICVEEGCSFIFVILVVLIVVCK